jgi:hypothetical protein
MRAQSTQLRDDRPPHARGRQSIRIPGRYARSRFNSRRSPGPPSYRALSAPVSRTTIWCTRIRNWCASISLPGSAPRHTAIRCRPASDSTTGRGGTTANRERRRSSPAIPAGRDRTQQVLTSRAYSCVSIPAGPSQRGRSRTEVSLVDRATPTALESRSAPTGRLPLDLLSVPFQLIATVGRELRGPCIKPC